MKRLIAMAIVLAMGCEDRAVVLSQGDASSAARTTAVDMGPFHLCAISNGNVRCAGQGSSLALGRADGANTSVFLPLDTPLGGLTAVAVGRQFTCVLDGEGAVRCFGTNDHAQLGAIPPSTSTAPIPVVLPGPAASIAAGEAYACAVLRDGSLHCWGTDRECQLANEDHLDHPEPLRIAPGTGFVEVSTGQAHACAIAIDGSLYCWGRNANGQIGAGPMGVQACTPQRVGAGSWRHVSCGQQSTCAIAAEGSLYCWGEDMQSD
jgi:alpha-tubulin suppressor-like RCC1 family protein